MKWWKGLLGLETDRPPAIEQKSIIGVNDGLSQWSGASRQDGTNFRTNTVTLADWSDRVARSNPVALSATWACVNLLAGTIGSLPLMVYRDDPAKGRVVAKDHPLYWLLHDSPNRDQTSLDFWEFMSAGIELQGNAYAEIKRDSVQTNSLVPIRPDLVTVSRGPAGLEYRWTDEGQPRFLPQEQVLHIRGFGGTRLGGLSTLRACAGTFGAALAAENAASNIFANGATPSGILSMPNQESLTKPQRDEIEGLLQEKFAGALNAGRPMLLDRGITWQQLTISPEDAQMLESRKFGGEEICRLFGVPPAMVGYGDKASNWGTGKEVDVIGFLKFTLRRRLKRIEQALMKQLLTVADRRAGVTIEFNIEGLLRADSAARAGFYTSGLSNGWMTINEVRALENLPPVEGGEVPRMQMQNVPITEAGTLPEPGDEE